MVSSGALTASGGQQTALAIEFELQAAADQRTPRRGAPGSRRLPTRGARRSRLPPFASLNMQAHQQQQQQGEAGAQQQQQAPRRRAAQPAFVVASAVEGGAPARLAGVPQWRYTAGDLAAGATAGCAVEAGAGGQAGRRREGGERNSDGHALRAPYRAPHYPLPHPTRASALYPIDTIKTRLQAMRSGGGIRALLQASARGGGSSVHAGTAAPHPSHSPPSHVPSRARSTAGGRRARPVRRRVGQPGGCGPCISNLYGSL